MARPKRKPFYAQIVSKEILENNSWIVEYNNNSRVVIEYLVSSKAKKTAYYASLNGLEKLKDYLVSTKKTYSYSEALEWYDSLNSKDNYLITIQRLNEVYETGSIKHYCLYAFNLPIYTELNEEWKSILDDFLKSLNYLPSTINKTRFVLSRFFYKAQQTGITPYDITYSFVSEYIAENKHQRNCENLQDILAYMASYGYISPILQWYPYLEKHNRVIYNEMLTSIQINEIETIMSERTCFQVDEAFIELAIEFTKQIKSAGYSVSVVKEARYTIHSLLVFLNINHYPYNPEIADIWLDIHKTSIRKTECKSLKRILFLFDSFLEEKKITPERKNMFKKLKCDSLPDWCKTEFINFINLKKKEGWCKSTIDMYRYSVTRFCFSLIKQGITSFSEITHETIHLFNISDTHETAEGKNAYNCRIRNFLKYLERNEIIPYGIHISLYTVFQKKERIVTTLTKEEMHEIAKRLSKAKTEIELRNRAILMIGLKMGLRACDIVNLRTSNIDWKRQTIKIVQQKTLYEIEVPMPTEVGNAIYLYLKNRKTNSDILFTKAKIPFNAVTKSVCNSALKRTLPERSISGSGFHVTRRTFATELLKNNVKKNVISDLLGHRNKEQLMKYLNLDSDRMFLCPLSLEETNLCMEVNRYD